MTRRRGVSLIELLVIMGTIMIMMTLCVGLIQTLIRIDRSSRSDIAIRSGMSKMAEVFRADVHAARQVDPGQGTHDRVVLSLPEGMVVEYRAEPGRLVRVKSQADTVKHQDAFRLPRQATAKLLIEPAEPGGTAIVSVVLSARNPAVTPWRNERVDAALGKDHRWQLASGK